MKTLVPKYLRWPLIAVLTALTVWDLIEGKYVMGSLEVVLVIGLSLSYIFDKE